MKVELNKEKESIIKATDLQNGEFGTTFSRNQRQEIIARLNGEWVNFTYWEDCNYIPTDQQVIKLPKGTVIEITI